MANDLDLLMDIDPTKASDKDIDAIIAYQRQARANADAGIKPKKETGKITVSLDQLGLAKPPPKMRRL